MAVCIFILTEGLQVYNLLFRLLIFKLLRLVHALRMFKILKCFHVAKHKAFIFKVRYLCSLLLTTHYCSEEIKNEIAGHVAHVEERRVAFRVLMGRKSLGKPRRSWVDNIKVDLGEVGSGAWTDLAQDKNRRRALVNTVMNFRVP